jgi:hypothetical protein
MDDNPKPRLWHKLYPAKAWFFVEIYLVTTINANDDIEESAYPIKKHPTNM